MHDAISFLKDAINRGPISAGTSDCYIVEPDMIRANNECMHAGINWESGTSFVIPAVALDGFLARCKEVKNIKVSEDAVIFKSGRIQSTISRRFQVPVPPPTLPSEWHRSPPGLGAALKVAVQFTNEQATGGRIWQTGVRLWDGRVTACNGATFLDILLDGLAIDQPRVLFKKQADFLIAQGDPDEFGWDKHTLSFRWEDGRWVRFRLIDGTFPEEIFQQLFDTRVGKEAPIAITDEWREAYQDAMALCDGTVGVTPEGFKAIKEHIESMVELETGVQNISWWNSKDLGKVIAVADAWNPANYPEATLFIGNNIKGCIAGVQR